ncbi:FAD-binding protein [Succinimonas sp.]|uniref:FAD-binding protein n=1 Tax=Succinimonas sp. TaxID=1936151 RepID=UPI003865AB33
MAEKNVFDVAIIGLGPSGATFARLLDPRLKVLALDKKDNTENSFQKPCGGLLAHDAQKCFARFGLTLPLEVLVNPQIFAVRTIDLETGYERYYQRFYINMDRHKFDLWLKSLIPAHAEVRNGVTALDFEKRDDCYAITVRDKEKRETYYARYLVGADGANSAVRQRLFPDHKIRSYLAIQQWFPDTHKSPMYSCIFDRNLTDCYSWGVSKDDSFILGGAFPNKGARERFRMLKTKLAGVGFKLENPIRTETCLVLSPASSREFCLGGDRCFLLGEAAGFISPSSLEGMSYAFESAASLAGLFNRKSEVTLKDYRRATRGLRAKLMLKLLKKPFIMGHFLRKLIMRSGISSLKVAAQGCESSETAPPK